MSKTSYYWHALLVAIYKLTKLYDKFFYIKNAGNGIIEKVLENGRDIEFVGPELLQK